MKKLRHRVSRSAPVCTKIGDPCIVLDLDIKGRDRKYVRCLHYDTSALHR